MDIDALDRMLVQKMKSGDSKTYIRSIAHWLKKIKQEGGEYSTVDEKETRTLENIASLGLLHIEEIRNVKIAFLTPEAESLMKDFFRKGYYMQAQDFSALKGNENASG
ncbi:MAG: hypothetical protein HYT73_02765 [Candidatus Aenigmarchaeota archaeon]|nr:hypothetical protein [Candidatus Aenigmarchaeota archaeon]